ncbi:MAG: LacI family DNA-binding transcriptional regulator [Anaerolineae bacterium]
MSISIKDIARIAGVSHSTVSRALRYSPVVNADTAEAIRRIAADLGYTPSAIARGLVHGRTYSLGFVVSRIAHPFMSEVVEAVGARAQEHGYDLIVVGAGDPQHEVAAVRMLRERRVDGILVQASRVGEQYTSLLDEIGVPIVLINNQAGGRTLYSVACDHVAGARLAVRYLLARGHTRIGHLPGPTGATAAEERQRGWAEAMREAGLAPDAALLAHAPVTAWTPEEGVAQTLELLRRAEPPTAIFCYNDIAAIGALRAARMTGRAVPRDLSIVGFDDIMLAGFTDPPLTTVAQPTEALGQAAVEMMLALIDEKDKGQKLREAAREMWDDELPPPDDGAWLASAADRIAAIAAAHGGAAPVDAPGRMALLPPHLVERESVAAPV